MSKEHIEFLFTNAFKNQNAAVQLLIRKSWEKLKTDVMAEVTQDSRYVSKLQQEVEDYATTIHQQSDALHTLKATLTKQNAILEQERQRHRSTLEAANQVRKDAAARGNRYKHKYEQLLEDIDVVIPGAKTLLQCRVLTEEEKARRLAKLDAAIKKQREAVDELSYYNRKFGATTYEPGYGKQSQLLQRLLDKKEKITAIKSY